MARAFIERHIRTLSLAQACMQLGARLGTTSFITGLSHCELSKLYLPGEHIFRCGRPPASPHWLIDKTNCVVRAELSIFASIFIRITDQGFAPGDGVVAAYKLYVSACADHPRVSFDRAFDVACHLKGMWTHPTVSLGLYPCSHCGSLCIASIGDRTAQRHGCVFCHLLERYDKDHRIQANFPKRRPRPGQLSHAGAGATSPLLADAKTAPCGTPIPGG